MRDSSAVFPFALALRAAAFVLLLPGTVGGYFAFLILRTANGLIRPRLSASSAGGALLLLAGVAVVLRCVWDFFATGQGTLAPVDPPKRLVVAGLYRHTRNPMYNGVLAAILGEAWLFRSAVLFEYALGVFVAFHLFVVLYEERALASRFSAEYAAYRRSVPRWGFTVRPYDRRLVD
jgi:protein-S-isoprenylcysteine O-methyltransferase Ste14